MFFFLFFSFLFCLGAIGKAALEKLQSNSVLVVGMKVRPAKERPKEILIEI